MSPETDLDEPGIEGNDGGEEEPLSDLQLIAMAAAGSRFTGNVGEIEFWENTFSVQGLIEDPEARQHLHKLRQSTRYGQQVADGLATLIAREKERREALEAQRTADERKEQKDALRRRMEDEAKAIALKQQEAELLAEIEAETAVAAAKVSGQPTQNDLDAKVAKRIAGILQEVDEIRRTPGGPEFEQKVSALELATGPARALADWMSDPTKLAAERVDRWNETDLETRELASQMYGVGGVFDIDPVSPEYRDGLEAAKKKAAETEAWVAEQTASGGS